MSQSGPQPPAPASPSGAGAPPQPAFSQRRAAIVAIVVVLVVALGLTFFAAFATSALPLPLVTAPATATATVAHTPTVPPPPTPAPTAASAQGLPAGMTIDAFALTGPDEGWGSGALNPDPVTGVPQAGMVLHYSAGVWTQVGPSLPGTQLRGIDMVSPTEGWLWGADANSSMVMLHISGPTWSRATLEPLAGGGPKGISVLAMRAPDEGWLAVINPKSAQGGLATTLYHDSGGSWSQVYGLPAYITYVTDIAPIAPDEAWVIGTDPDGRSALALMRNGSGTITLTSPAYSTFSRLRVFASNDIWIEGATHAGNLTIYDSPLDYHYDGTLWAPESLSPPNLPQHISVISSDTVWGIAYIRQTPSLTGFPPVSSISSNAGGLWTTVPLPYTDLFDIQVLSTSSADVWALASYMVTTQTPNGSSSTGQYVLLRYAGGAWTAYGR